MKKVIILILTTIILYGCALRNEKVVIKYVYGGVDTVQLRYRGKLSLSQRGDLYDGVNDLKAMNVRSFSIIK